MIYLLFILLNDQQVIITLIVYSFR